MTETPRPSTESTSAAPEVITPPRYDDTGHQTSRLYQVLAWVGIIGGVLFIVAVIFFSGVFFGRVSGGYHGWHRGYQSGQMGSDGSMGDWPMMQPGGIGPGGMMGPGGTGPGGTGPGQLPPSMMPPFTQRPS